MAVEKPYRLVDSSSASIITAEAVLEYWTKQGLPDEWVADVANNVATARTQVERFKDESAKVLASELLTDRGRAHKLAELRDDVLPEISRIRREATKLRQRAETERAAAVAAFAPPKGLDGVLEHLQLQERRTYLRTLDPIVLAAAYESAARTGDDPQLERAVESAPWAFSQHVGDGPDGKVITINPITPQLLAKGAESRALRLRPIVGDLDRVADLYESVASGIGQETGLETPELVPIA